MARRTGLREFQLSVAERIRTASTRAALSSRLGFQVGADNWFVPLHQVNEVIPVPPTVPVPLTHSWFRGVANIRGNLYSVIDFAGYLGRGNATAASHNRLVLFGPRTGELNAALVVQRVLGLRNLAELAPAAPAAQAPAWYAQRWIDADGNAWQEIDLAKLAREPAFLQVGE